MHWQIVELVNLRIEKLQHAVWTNLPIDFKSTVNRYLSIDEQYLVSDRLSFFDNQVPKKDYYLLVRGTIRKDRNDWLQKWT